MIKETMVTSMEDGGWRKGDAQPDRGWTDEQQDVRLPAVSRCYYGLVCWQGLLRTGSAPKTPSAAKPSVEQEKLHSFQ